MITKLAIVHSKCEGQYVLIEPLTGVIIGKSVIYEFMKEAAYGFMECLDWYTKGRVKEFRFPADKFAYLYGAKIAAELCDEFIAAGNKFPLICDEVERIDILI